MAKRQPRFADMEPAHEIRDFLAAHEAAFVAKYGTKPARYTAKDAKHAKDLIAYYGYTGALVMLKRFFASADKFIAGSGHGLGILAMSTVQNKLIAEAYIAETPAQRQMRQTADVRRLMAEGLPRAEAIKRVFS